MTRLVIDTDVALGIHHEGRPRDIDDGFAIVEAINTPGIELMGITCVYGNAPHADVYRVANEIISIKGVNVPVVAGAQAAMSDHDITNPAVEFLADALSKGPLTIAAIGPLTNIGLLANRYPDLMQNLEQLIMVAGRTQGRTFYLGDAGPVRDFNFENDPRAARFALQAGAPAVLAGFELTSQVCITEDDLRAIGARGDATADYFHRNSLDWCRYWTGQFPQDTGFHPWDSAAIAWITHPEWFVAEARGWHVLEVKPDTYWLETSKKFHGDKVTYCTGFADGGAAAFVNEVVNTVY